MSFYHLSPQEHEQFDADGYIIVEDFLKAAEIDLLRKIAKADHAFQQQAIDRHDASGNLTRLVLQNDLKDDVYSASARSARVVETMAALLGGEVYHYHHKMILKEPRVGGAWEWHQDYGYWYNNGCLFPHMASCLIAIDPATKENGCLQVIRGSHLMGRVEHVAIHDQTGADPERVEQALKRMDHVYCEVPPGAAIFFHGNTLHASAMNASENPRWSLICCYNAARNNPYKAHHHPCYSPLEIWPDERVLEVAQREWADMAALSS